MKAAAGRYQPLETSQARHFILSQRTVFVNVIGELRAVCLLFRRSELMQADWRQGRVTMNSPHSIKLLQFVRKHHVVPKRRVLEQSQLIWIEQTGEPSL